MAEFDVQVVTEMAAANTQSTQAKRDAAEAKVWAGLRDRLAPVITSPVVTPPVVTTPATGLGTFARPFLATSPWNTPIPATAKYDATSGRALNVRNYAADTWLNIEAYSAPVFEAKASDPLVTLVAPSYGGGTVSLRIPAAARPAVGATPTSRSSNPTAPGSTPGA